MKNACLFLVGLILTGCVTAQRPVEFVPAREAAWFKFPPDLPTEGQVKIPATLATAIQLAVADYFPWDVKLSSGMSPFDACLREPASYDVEAAQGPEGVVFVSIWLSPGACGPYQAALDVGGMYAVDVRNWRILAVQR